MKPLRKMAAIALLTVFLISVGACAGVDAAADPDGSLTVPARHIPLPAAASHELREAIRSVPLPVYPNSRTAPSSEDEWLSMIKGADAGATAFLDGFARERDVSISAAVIAGVRVHQVVPATVSEQNKDRLFLFLHGGAYVFGSGRAGTTEAVLIADRLSMPVLSVDYRMPPADPFPAAIQDVAAVYQDLLASRAPGAIMIGGTSAGGGLALASVHHFMNLELPVPGAVFAGTPWADLTKTGDTLFTHDGLDRVLVSYEGLLGAAADLYAHGEDLGNPRISPLYGDFKGFPPTILFSGTRDMFLSDVTRTHRKLRAAGVVADLHIYEGMSHAGYLLVPDAPESLNLFKELADFMARHLLD